VDVDRSLVGKEKHGGGLKDPWSCCESKKNMPNCQRKGGKGEELETGG